MYRQYDWLLVPYLPLSVTLRRCSMFFLPSPLLYPFISSLALVAQCGVYPSSSLSIPPSLSLSLSLSPLAKPSFSSEIDTSHMTSRRGAQGMSLRRSLSGTQFHTVFNSSKAIFIPKQYKQGLQNKVHFHFGRAKGGGGSETNAPSNFVDFQCKEVSSKNGL